MQPYSQFRPTQFDAAGLGIEDRQNWLVLGLSQTRDSGTLEQSNFASALEQLGGESESVEVHRFGHWGPGWFEIIIIDPADGAKVRTAEEIESALESYPVLDETDWSERENQEYQTAWQHWIPKDFADCLQKHLGLNDTSADRLWDSDVPLQELYEELTPSGDYWEENHMCSRLESAAKRCTRGRMAEFLRANRRKKAA